jgi:hypothetical protein
LEILFLKQNNLTLYLIIPVKYYGFLNKEGESKINFAAPLKKRQILINIWF